MADRSARLCVLAAFAALVGWSAVTLQFVLTMRIASENNWGAAAGVLSYFSFFTIVTNIVAAVLFSALAVPAWKPGRFFAGRGVISAITAAMVLLGAAYSLLLRRAWNPHGWQFVADEALQDVMPLLVLVYWWFAVPRGAVRWADIPGWMLYPIAYLVYLFVRGEITLLYPYHFIDVEVIGYGQALLNSVVALLAFAAIASALVAANSLKRRPA